MRKVFCIRDFNQSSQLEGLNALLVAFKKNGSLTLKNVVCNPEDRMSVSVDPKTDEVVFRFKVRDNEFLAIGQD